jgi:simple sugar transport system ATP-binding protein
MAPPALELHGISKRFGRVQALAEADLVVHPGEVHALLGENGAGKTTLLRIAFGLIQPDRGTIRIEGRPVTVRSPRQARALGLGMVHQHFTSIPTFTVAENLALVGRRRPLPADDAILGRLLATLDPALPVERLTVGEKQRLEIAKALVTEARILLLDEPTAVLTPAETADLMQLLRAYAARGGGVVLITHKLREALEVADTVTVLRRGQVTARGPMSSQTPESLAAAMLGSVADRPAGSPTVTQRDGGAAEVLVRLDRVTVPPFEGRGPGLRDASLTVHAGEIVGIAALEGQGRRELMLAVAGLLRPVSGRIEVSGIVALVPEDRTTEGLIPELTLVENVVVGGGPAPPWRRGLWLDWAAAERHTAAILRAFDVHAPGPRVPAELLSGGNQQRLVLGRALSRQPPPRVLVVEHPTRGLDLRATESVHTLLRQACTGGLAVLVHSEDLDEVLELAGRVVVVTGGRLVELPPGVSREAVGAALLDIGR